MLTVRDIRQTTCPYLLNLPAMQNKRKGGFMKMKKEYVIPVACVITLHTKDIVNTSWEGSDGKDYWLSDGFDAR